MSNADRWSVAARLPAGSLGTRLDSGLAVIAPLDCGAPRGRLPPTVRTALTPSPAAERRASRAECRSCGFQQPVSALALGAIQRRTHSHGGRSGAAVEGPPPRRCGSTQELNAEVVGETRECADRLPQSIEVVAAHLREPAHIQRRAQALAQTCCSLRAESLVHSRGDQIDVSTDAGTGVAFVPIGPRAVWPLRRPLSQVVGGEPSTVDISSSAWFSASLICLPPMPRKPPSLWAVAAACATVITNFL